METPGIAGLVIISAPQGAGKSHLIKYLMRSNRRKLDYGIVFCNTYFDGCYERFLPKESIHPEYSEEKLAALLKLQSVDKPAPAFVVFDDCLDHRQFNSEVLKKCCTQLRHYNLYVIFSTQYTNLIPSYIKCNAMEIFMFKTEQENNIKAMYTNFGRDYNNLAEFTKVIKGLPKYTFLTYSRMKDEKTKKMKCPEKIPDFKINF